jgi:hypothetical protein
MHSKVFPVARSRDTSVCVILAILLGRLVTLYSSSNVSQSMSTEAPFPVDRFAPVPQPAALEPAINNRPQPVSPAQQEEKTMSCFAVLAAALRQNQSYQGVSKSVEGAVSLRKTALDSIGFPYSNSDFALAPLVVVPCAQAGKLNRADFLLHMHLFSHKCPTNTTPMRIIPPCRETKIEIPIKKVHRRKYPCLQAA